MFRAPVLRRNFSLFNRVPYSRIAHSAAQDGHESVTIHRVRIRKPFASRSRIIGTLAIAGAFWSLSRYISIEVEVEKVEENGQDPTGPSVTGDAADEDEDHDEYEDALVFLPTGFSRPRPKTFYRGSDPEWQEFKKLATDRPRVEKLRNELTSTMRKLAQNNPSWTTRLGKIDPNKGKAWIELKFPDGPPIEYERPGIALTEDLEWRKATRPVEDIHHQRLNKILFPTEVSNALYQDIKRKAQLSWKGFKASMGLGEKPEPETVQGVVQRVFANPPTPPNAGVSVTPTASSPPAATTVGNPDPTDPASSLSSQAKELGFVLPDPKNLTLDLTKFRQDFRKSFKPYALQPPRGTVLVLGLIEIYGDRARITLNVTATYDPKQGRYVGVKAGVWNLVDHSQRPRGGP